VARTCRLADGDRARVNLNKAHSILLQVVPVLRRMTKSKGVLRQGIPGTISSLIQSLRNVESLVGCVLQWLAVGPAGYERNAPIVDCQHRA
jgi:hypothetical protein